MRRALRKSHSRISLLGARRHCTAAQHFSQMWGVQSGTLTPSHGPHQMLESEALQDVHRALQEKFRELCSYQRKHVELARISARREEREDDLQQIADQFYLKGREAVCDFLRQHRSLIPILAEVRQKFDEYFGVTENHGPRLEVFVDAEEDSQPKLFALALVAPSAEVSAQLDRMDQEWWLEQPYEVRRLMNIDVEYVDASV